MKKPHNILLFLLFILYAPSLFAQTNISLLGHLPLADQVSALWGYADNGKEYALVGTVEGTVLVDVTTPNLPQILQFIPGHATPYWREIKTWQHYAYVVSESGGNVQIFDLSTLPSWVSHSTWKGDLWQGDSVKVNKVHTLWIDENGIMYLNGTNNDLVMADLNTDPLNPDIVGLYQAGYVHDCYVRNDTMCTAEIYNGHFSIVDVSDKANPIVLATQTTPSNFTHNTWLSDNGQYLFTTDEKSGAYITAYDITDLSDIKETDRYRTASSGVIPHNTHVLGNFLVTSYYRDGVTIMDASNPHNLVEVGKYDTSPLAGDGFNGVWEVYPYLPSGNLIAGDMEEGLFILQPTYVQAAYLQGTITDQATGAPLSNVSVTIDGYDNASTQTQFGGTYSTGIPTSGTYQVNYFLYGYYPISVAVNFNNGETSLSDVNLVPITPFYATIQVNDTNGQAIPNAQVSFYSDLYQYEAITNDSGTASVALYYGGNYRAAAGKWGYKSQQSANINIIPDEATTANLVLPLGYYDDFLFDFGWTSTNTGATAGDFTRALPHGIVFLTDTVQPFADITQDLGGKCFVSGNSALLSDNVVGKKTLQSPLFDATAYNDALISFYRWTYFQDNNGVGQAANDTLFIRLSNGSQTITLDTITNNDVFQSQWRRHKYRIAQYLSPSNQMQLILEASDWESTPHVVDIGVDYFKVVENIPPIAAFSVNQNTHCGAADFQLTDLSSGDVEQWQWIINTPSGEVISSKEQNPLVNLSEVGAYSVSLSIFGVNGFDVHSETAFIYIYPEPAAIQFNDFATSVCPNTEVWVSWESSEPAPQYTWSGNYVVNSGDNYIAVQAPVGEHEYSVTATDANGCTAVNGVALTVNAAPLLPEVMQNGNSCIGETINLSIANPQADETYTWQMTDMPATVSPNFSFTPETPNTYSYLLTAQNSHNCSTTFADSLLLFPLPQINVLQNLSTSLCPDSIYTLQLQVDNNTGIAPYNYEWNSNYVNIISFDNSNGTLLAELNTETLLPETPIFYTYTAIDAQGCQSAYSHNSTLINCIDATAQPALLPSTLSVQPNPATDKTTISLDHITPAQPANIAYLQLYNAIGQLIWTKKVNIQGTLFKETLSLGEFAAGHYIISIKTADKAWQAPLIIYKR
jgi:choice-of-anchor B domain-containing protein